MERKGIQSLQVLRGVASIAVVLHHAIRAVTVNKGALILAAPWVSGIPAVMRFGAAGVDLFFVLSGFLMVLICGPYLSGKRSVGDFLLQRAVRIWPMYAFATLWLVVPLIREWHQTGILPFDLRPIRLASLAFVPSLDAGGLLQPILGVGWTLNYEAGFYLTFAIAMLVPWGDLLARLALILVGWQLVGLLIPGTVASLYLGNTIVAEFFFGALIARLYQFERLPLRRSSFLITLGVGVLVVAAIVAPSDLWRFAVTGVGAALLFIGFLGLEGKVRWPRFIVELGDASYSIYLVHIIFIYDYGPRLLRHVPLQTDLAALVLLLISTIVGYAAYRLVETPLLVIFRRLIFSRAPKVVVIPTKEQGA